MYPETIIAIIKFWFMCEVFTLPTLIHFKMSPRMTMTKMMTKKDLPQMVP